MSLPTSSLGRMTTNGHAMEEMDPLDAFMATLSADASVSQAVPVSTADARAAARAYRKVQSSPATSVDVAVRNRRYTRLQQLLDKSKTSSASDWYFSDEMMQQRNPALYHLHLGQYLNVASRQQRAPQGADGVTLSAFLMETCDRQVMEARRVQEQRTWGRYRSVDDKENEEEEEEEEEEDDDEDSDEETKESDAEASVDSRREQLIELMSQRFLDGCDGDFVDYAAIDGDQALDDMEQMQRDAEERYFDSDDYAVLHVAGWIADMSKLPLKPGTLARLAPTAAVSVVVVDAELAAKFHTLCQQGDIDACHMTLLKLQQRYPESVHDQDDDQETSNLTPAKHQRMLATYQPLYDILGHGFSAAATANHVDLIEYLLSSAFASMFRDGICMDKLRFPPFALLRNHELACCVSSIRFVAFAALACVDQLALRSFQLLVETQTLWDFEASLCLSLAMRHALTAATRDASTSSVSPAAFHPMIVLLTKHYDFLVDEIRWFHEKFRPTDRGDDRAWDQFESMQALQASLLYEIVLASSPKTSQ